MNVARQGADDGASGSGGNEGNGGGVESLVPVLSSKF